MLGKRAFSDSLLGQSQWTIEISGIRYPLTTEFSMARIPITGKNYKTEQIASQYKACHMMLWYLKNLDSNDSGYLGWRLKTVSKGLNVTFLTANQKLWRPRRFWAPCFDQCADSAGFGN